MGYIVGLDVGGSFTKIVAMKDRELVYKSITAAGDPVASAYGALGKLINDLHVSISDIEKINMTGVGSGFPGIPMLGIETVVITEFEATGLGGLYLSGLDKAVVVSMGTGTAYLEADFNNVKHIIGSGVGGGTLVGLGRAITGIEKPDKMSDLATTGDIDKVDLTIGDISKTDVAGLAEHVTASNFGKSSEEISNNDKMLGVFNLVFQSIGTMSVLASRLVGINDVVFTGQLTTFKECKESFALFPELYRVNFIIPDDAEFGTAIGSCLAGGL